MRDIFKDRRISFLIGLLGLFLIGALFFAVYHGWILFSFPSYKSAVRKTIIQMRPEKKDVMLHYWHNKKWCSEKVNLLWSQDKSKNIKYVVNSWLNLLEEEEIMEYKVSLRTALTSRSSDQAYLSFDRNPLPKNSSTYDKLMWLEGILKTIRENDITLQTVYFLFHHQIMQDYHLDFSSPWPISGFARENKKN
ncbi:hypothetical protein ACFLYU_03675 [Candidatus Dependentiae bacterium]